MDLRKLQTDWNPEVTKIGSYVCSIYSPIYKHPSTCDTFTNPIEKACRKSNIFDKTNIALYTGKFINIV